MIRRIEIIIIFVFLIGCFFLTSCYPDKVDKLISAIETHDRVQVNEILSEDDTKEWINKKGGSVFPFSLFDETMKRTPFEAAVEAGDLDVIRIVVDHGANPKNSSDDEEDPLAWIIDTHEWSDELQNTILFLIQKGADPDGNIKFTDSIPLLSIAWLSDSNDSNPTPKVSERITEFYIEVEALCDEKSPISGDLGYSPLHAAVLSGNIPLINYLLDENPTMINLQDNEGMTPLFHVFNERDLSRKKAKESARIIADLLLKRGADVSIKDSSGREVKDLDEYKVCYDNSMSRQ